MDMGITWHRNSAAEVLFVCLVCHRRLQLMDLSREAMITTGDIVMVVTAGEKAPSPCVMCVRVCWCVCACVCLFVCVCAVVMVCGTEVLNERSRTWLDLVMYLQRIGDSDREHRCGINRPWVGGGGCTRDTPRIRLLPLGRDGRFIVGVNEEVERAWKGQPEPPSQPGRACKRRSNSNLKKCGEPGWWEEVHTGALHEGQEGDGGGDLPENRGDFLLDLLLRLTPLLAAEEGGSFYSPKTQK